MPAITFGVLVIVIVAASCLSAGFQTNFGTIKVESLTFTDRNGVPLTAKLYLPADASASNPVPGVLALHGFNNDKNVMRPQAIELAKNGIAVLTVDQEGAGDSGGNYSSDGELSAISCFDSYTYMTSLPFINKSDCGIMGHSLGAIRSVSVALANPTMKMFIFETFNYAFLQLFGINSTTFPLLFHNYLQISATWEEFDMSTNETVSQWLAQGQTAYREVTGNPTAVSGQNYGNFATGTANRWAVETSTHPGLTADPAVVSEVVAWALQSLKGESYAQAWAAASPAKQTYLGAEICGLVALGALMVSIMPLGAWLLQTKIFESLKQPRVKRTYWKRPMWWLWATVAAAIGGVTYVYFTSFHSATMPFGSSPTSPLNPLIVPGLGIGVATGFMTWFMINTGIGAVLTCLWYFLAKRRDKLTAFDLGSAIVNTKGGTEIEGFTPPTDRKFWASYMAKTIVLAFILYAWMYLMILWADWALNIDMNGIWTEFAPLTTTRAAEFWVYLWPVLAFFVVNGGIYLFGEMRQGEWKSGAATQLAWWIKACYLLLGGLIVVICIQYVPFWFGYGPGLNGNIENSSNISPLMPIQLMSFIPFAAMLIFIMVFFYRHTGRIYLGAIIVAVLAVWFQMVGLVMYF